MKTQFMSAESAPMRPIVPALASAVRSASFPGIGDGLDDSETDFRAGIVQRVRAIGRAIFEEPVRDSGLLRAVRKMIPYRAPDVSPFERPLTSPELRRFASPFRTESVRAFSLPFVNAAHALSPVFAPVARQIDRLYRIDRALLRRFPAFARLAGIRVMAVSKPVTAV